MSIEHRNLTGAELHEPKGAETATLGQVYVADGLGSGAWQSKNADILNANSYFTTGTMADIGTTGDSVFFYVPQKSSMTSLVCVLYGAIATTDTILSIYVNGVLFGDTLVVPIAGSGAGTQAVKALSTNTVNAGSVIEVRTDGATTSTVKASISVVLANIS